MEESEQILVEDDTPKGYFLTQLLGKGIKTCPRAFNPNSPNKITCCALRYRTEDELPQMYDNDLLKTMYDSPLDVVESRVSGLGNEKAKLVANAQNPTGETLLMKICRRSLTSTPKGNSRGLKVVSLLLKAGANPMTCCDSGRNVLHDVFWTAKPPPEEVLAAMEKMVETLREHTGKDGILELLLSEDKHGYTPLDYVVPSQQPNWRNIVDTVVAWATEEALKSDTALPDIGAPQKKLQEKPQESPVQDNRDQVCIDGVISRVLEIEAVNRTKMKAAIDNMCAEDRRLLTDLSSTQSSFLLSDVTDPDAAIVACSPSFMHETGYEAREVLGRNCRFLQGPGTSTAQVDLIRKALKLTATVNVSVLNYKRDGNVFLNNFLLTPLRANDGTCTYFIGIQNCHPQLVEDRRRNLAAAGFVWIDDSEILSAVQQQQKQHLLSSTNLSGSVPDFTNLSRAISTETITVFPVDDMHIQQHTATTPTTGDINQSRVIAPHSKRKLATEPETNAETNDSKRGRASPPQEQEATVAETSSSSQKASSERTCAIS